MAFEQALPTEINLHRIISKNIRSCVCAGFLQPFLIKKEHMMSKVDASADSGMAFPRDQDDEVNLILQDGEFF
jgi:hypothetical protein